MNINRKPLLMFSLVLLLSGCSSSTEQVIDLESAQKAIPKDAFCNLYTDNMNYQSGILDFGNHKISYAFPNHYSISEDGSNIFIWDTKNDIYYEVYEYNNDNIDLSSLNDCDYVDNEYQILSQLFGSEFSEQILQSEDISELETQSSSSEFGFINQTKYFFEYKGDKVYIPLTSVYVNLGDITLFVRASKLSSLSECPVDKVFSSIEEIYKLEKGMSREQANSVYDYFIKMNSDSESLYKETLNLFSYLYYGDIVSEGIETSLSDYGSFPFYMNSVLTISDLNKLIMSKDIKANSVLIDDMYLTYFYQDKYFEAGNIDNIITWDPVDGEHNNQLFELIISDNYYDEESIISEIISIANSYVYGQNDAVFVSDEEKSLYNHIGVQKTNIDTFSISDSLRDCRQYQAYFMYEGSVKETFNLPVIYYTINYNGKTIMLRTQYNLSFISKENLELFNKIELKDFKDLKSVLSELSNSDYDSFIDKTHYMQSCSDSLNKTGLGLLRLLYAGNFSDLKGELSYEK